MQKNLISPEQLKNNLHKKDLILLDASPIATVSGKTSPYSHLCIPNSRIFDIKGHFTDKEGRFPNTIPSPAQFEKACQLLGINSESEIMVYDNLGIYTSPRVWWLFQVMGHANVKVLDGGLVEWIKEGYPTINKSDLPSNYEAGNFKSNFQEAFLIQYENVLDNIESKKFLVVDARSAGRFNGTAPEPRKHLQSGHIPNSVNIPYDILLEDGKFKSKQEIQEIFKERINSNHDLVFSCGSGMTACIVMLASTIAFRESPYLYDGSWTEYAELQGLRKEV